MGKISTKQSEIWLVNLDPTTGAEIKKSRPCVIINNSKFGRLPLKVVVPFTDWKEAYDSVSWMIRISPDAANGLSKESAIDCFQIRSLSEQ